jgi:hypothetical protein
LDYRVNWSVEFSRALKKGNLDDEDILQQYTALLLYEFTGG